MGRVKFSASAHCALCSERRAYTIFQKDGYEIVRCATCGLVYVANPPTDAEISAMYSFSSGYHVELTDPESHSTVRHGREAKRRIQLIREYQKAGRILDVGCSAGIFLEAARRSGWKAYGVEMSHDTAELARSRGLKVVTGTLADANFARRFFDVVTFWDVLEHLRDPLATLSRANDILVAGGLLVLSTPNVDGAFPRLSLRAARLTGVWRHPEPPYHLVQFSKTTIERAVELAGFEILKIIDRRIPLRYTFGPLGQVLRSPKRTAYAVAFGPIVLIGPVVKAGDWIEVIARKASSPAAGVSPGPQ